MVLGVVRRLQSVMNRVYLLAHPSHPPVRSLCAQLRLLNVAIVFSDSALFYRSVRGGTPSSPCVCVFEPIMCD